MLGKAFRNEFLNLFPDPAKLKKRKEASPYQAIINWFGEGNIVDVILMENDKTYKKGLENIPGLGDLVDTYTEKLTKNQKLTMMEFVLFGLAEHSLIGKNNIERGVQFKDILGSMFSEKDFFGDQSDN